MEDIFQQLDLLGGQISSATDASLCTEPSFVVPSVPPFTSPLHEAAMIATTEPLMPVVQSTYTLPADQSNGDQFYASSQLPTSPNPSAPYQHTDNQLAFMPTPSLVASASCSISEMLASTAQLGYGSMGPFPMMQSFTNTCSTTPPFDIPNQSFSITGDENYYHLPLVPPENPSTAYLGLENQAIPIQNQFLDTNLGRNLSDHLFPMGEHMEHNWEAITSYLAGHVRPGPDVPRIYRCNTCSLEFPNAQAFGGHMSSHSKLKKTENTSSPSVVGSSKKARLNKKVKLGNLQSSKKASASKASKRNKKTGGKPTKETHMEDKEKERASEPPTAKMQKENVGYVSDDSVSSEFFLGDTTSSNVW